MRTLKKKEVTDEISVYRLYKKNPLMFKGVDFTEYEIRKLSATIDKYTTLVGDTVDIHCISKDLINQIFKINTDCDIVCINTEDIDEPEELCGVIHFFGGDWLQDYVKSEKEKARNDEQAHKVLQQQTRKERGKKSGLKANK